ncbi:TPA: hypothetical protein ACGGRP_004444 [Escherichia coli]
MKHYSLSTMACSLFFVLLYLPAVADNKNTSSSLLPIFSELAKGYCVGVSHMATRQGIQVDNIRFSGMKPWVLPVDKLVDIRADRTWQKSPTETLHLDSWVQPFMNIYGVAGRTKGHSVSDVSIRPPVFTGGAFPSGKTQSLNSRLNDKGNTYGAGITQASGMNNMFMSLDANYTQTRFDAPDGHINAMLLTPRGGGSFFTAGDGVFSCGQSKSRMGGLYQHGQQTFRGKLSRLSLQSPVLQQWLKRRDKEGGARFEVCQHRKHPWNDMTEMRYDVTRHISLAAETDFKSIFVSGEYRF